MSSLDELKKSSLSGIISFALRSVIINVLKFLSVYLLAIWFVPEDYGTFGIILSWFGVSCFFCDIGLASVLVQQQQNPSKRQMETTLFIQLLLSSTIALIFIVFATEITQYNGMNERAVDMIRALFISLPILALRNPAKIELERSLGFKAIASIELMESLALYLTQLILAWRGLGAFSVIWANIVRTCFGSALYLLKCKTLFLPKLHLRTFKAMVPMGSKYQLNALLPSLKAMIFPLIVGRILDISTLGLVSWTLGIIALPQFLALNYNSIFFPVLSKLRSNKDEFTNMNLWSITLVLPIIGIIYVLLSLYGGDLASLIFSSKWQSAFEYFELAAIGFYLFLVRYLLAPIFNAGGRPQTRTKIESVSLFVELILVAIGSLTYGAKGYLSALIVSNLVSLYLSSREINLEFRKLLIKQLGYFAILYLICKLPKYFLSFQLAIPLSMIFGIIVSLILYNDYREILKRNIRKLRS